MTRGQQLFAIISSTTMTPYPVFTGCQATLYADLIGAFNSSGSARRRSVTDFRTHRFIPIPRPIRLAAFSRSSRTCSGLPFRRGVSRATGPLCASRSEPRSHTSYNSMISRITFNSAPWPSTRRWPTALRWPRTRSTTTQANRSRAILRRKLRR